MRKDESITYCAYCKEEIRDEACVVRGEDVYHVDCYNQMNCFLDEFGDVVPYYEEETDE